MTTIATELDDRLQRLDPAAVAHVEKLIFEALALAESRQHPSADQWPTGYFEQTAGAFADEPIERPPQGAFEKREAW